MHPYPLADFFGYILSFFIFRFIFGLIPRIFFGTEFVGIIPVGFNVHRDLFNSLEDSVRFRNGYKILGE